MDWFDRFFFIFEFIIAIVAFFRGDYLASMLACFFIYHIGYIKLSEK